MAKTRLSENVSYWVPCWDYVDTSENTTATFLQPLCDQLIFMCLMFHTTSRHMPNLKISLGSERTPHSLYFWTLVWSTMKTKEACIVAAAGILSLVIQGSSFCFYYRQRLCFQHMSATLHFLWDATKETVSKSLISFIIFRFHVQS